MVEFNWIEREYFTDYDRFVELYNDPLVSKGEMLILLGIGEGVYNTIRKELLRSGRITGNKRSNVGVPLNPRYYYKTNKEDVYEVRRHQKYVGRVKGLENVKKVVERLKDSGWDISQFKRIKKEVYDG